MESHRRMSPSTNRRLKLATTDRQVLTIRKRHFSVALTEASSFKEQWAVAMVVELAIRHRSSNNHTSLSYSNSSRASESRISLQAQQVLACTVRTMWAHRRELLITKEVVVKLLEQHPNPCTTPLLTTKQPNRPMVPLWINHLKMSSAKQLTKVSSPCAEGTLPVPPHRTTHTLLPTRPPQTPQEGKASAPVITPD